MAFDFVCFWKSQHCKSYCKCFGSMDCAARHHIRFYLSCLYLCEWSFVFCIFLCRYPSAISVHKGCCVFRGIFKSLVRYTYRTSLLYLVLCVFYLFSHI